MVCGVVSYVSVGGSMGKGTDGCRELTRLKNIGGIKCSGGSLLSLVVVEGDPGKKGKNQCFPLRCLIYCDSRI